MTAPLHDQRDVYERAEAVVDELVERQLLGEAQAALCRVVGKERAQIAICRAIIQVAGNILARLAGAAEAGRFHSERAIHYRVSAARAPARWGSKK
jgi:hypothetical protein